MSTIELRDYQFDHFNGLANIFSKSIFAIDTSSMRRGKSYVAYKIFQELGFSSSIVICPATVVSVWQNIDSTFKSNPMAINSYESWRSIKGNQPKHGYLTRKGDEFEVTEKFLSLLDNGLLFICDEFQKIKNKSDQYYAVKAAIQAITSKGGMNRILLLSGTPIDKEEQAINLLELLGIISNPKLFKFHSREERLELLGAKELYEYCLQIDKEKTKQLLREHPFSVKNSVHICYLLYVNIIHPPISSAMPQEEIENSIPLDVKNLYVILRPQDEIKYNNLVDAMGKATKYNPITKKTSLKELNWTSFTTWLKNLENVMVYSYVRKAIEELESNPNCKVILSFNYNSSIRSALKNLKDYNPLLLNGSIIKEDRASIIRKFQKPDLEYRLIITNLKVVSLGISFEDLDGRFPRIAYGSANYSAMDMLQWVSRFHSKDTKGTEPVKVRFLFGKSQQPLKSILNSIIRKSKVFKETLLMQVSYGFKFQDDYANEEEEDTENFDKINFIETTDPIEKNELENIEIIEEL